MSYLPNKNTRFTGDVQTTTPADGDNDQSVVTTAALQSAVGSASSNRPAASASFAADVSHATSGSLLLVSWTAEDFDTDGMYSTSSNPSRMYANTTGTYNLSACVTFSNSATTGRYIQVRKNSAGSSVGGTLVAYTTDNDTNASYYSECSISRNIQLTAGDYIEVFAFQASGAALLMMGGAGRSFLTMAWTGGTGAAWGNAGVKVYKTSPQTMTLANTFYNVTWDTEVFDTSAMHDTSSNTDRLVVQTPGLYDVKCNVLIAATTGAFYWTAHMYHYNSAGTLIRRAALAEGYQVAKGVTSYTQVSLNAHEPCDASDYFVVAIQTNVAGLTIYGDNTGFGSGGANFSAARVGYQTNPNKPTIVTALPASPSDGDECYYQSAAMVTAGIPPWHLRYRAASASTYKWEVLSAIPWQVETDSLASTSSATYVAGGLSLTTPLAGDYYVEQATNQASNNTAAQNTWYSFSVGGTAAIDADGVVVQQPTGATLSVVPTYRRRKKTSVSASVAIAEQIRATGGSTGSCAGRMLSITPIRVG